VVGFQCVAVSGAEGGGELFAGMAEVVSESLGCEVEAAIVSEAG